MGEERGEGGKRRGGGGKREGEKEGGRGERKGGGRGQGEVAAKQRRRDHHAEAEALEANVRRDFHKLRSNQAKVAARAAGGAVDVSADDFDDAD